MMPYGFLPLLALATLCAVQEVSAEDKTAPEFQPKVIVDTTSAPELAEWAANAKQLCERWYPRLVQDYATEGHEPAKTVTLIFKADYDGIAATSGDKITIAAKWLEKHPDDVGMVIHELMHVVQAYPRSSEGGWLIEGIADYVRYWVYEPDKKPALTLNHESSYKQGYGVAAAFLAWLERVKSPGMVMKLHTALRTKTYKSALFQDITGRSLDDLWAEFVAAGGKVPDLKPAAAIPPVRM